MGLQDLLRQLRKIEPNRDYTAYSRQHIVGTPFVIPQITHPRAFHFLSELLQSGAALALTGVAMLLLIGTFTMSNIFSSSVVANLDPVGLKAEAQAVDIQLQLTDISYIEPMHQALAETTTSLAHTKVNHEAIQKAQDLGLPVSAGVSSSSPTSSNEDQPLTIDQILDALSQ